MRIIALLSAALTTLLWMAGAAPVSAQERTPVQVRGSQIVTGVVIVDIQANGKSLELQCNDGFAHCRTLKSGRYIMVELPQNFGIYDCRNVEIYREDKDRPEGADLIGEYCLIEK